MNRIFTLLFGLFLSLYANSQQTRVDYDNDSRWFWTLNAGSTWTTADVTKKHDWGWGFTIGKAFNYNYGTPLSFDIRARYLGGSWYGQDGDTSGFQYGNAALSAADHDYKTAYGYAVLNHQTKVHELSLELVLHANNVRANSGWDPYIFGGIGYTWYRAKGNLTDKNNANGLYAYDSLVANNNVSVSSVENLLDDDYESVLDGSTNDFTGAFMPSLGFGLGYQAGPRFSLGFEHKTTFTLDDVFDGSVNPNGKYANDWYHYTGVYLKFHIKDHPVVIENTNTNTLQNVNNYDQTNTNIPPQVDFTNPATSGTVVSVANYVIKATIKNVASNNNVVFRQNGNYNQNFTFNPSTQQFESIVTLQPGQNIFELTGTNTVGSDQDQTIIIYNREQQNPPVVTYNNPAASPTTVQNPTFNVIATILNVDNMSQVGMTLNGAPVTGVNFTAANHTASANITLQVGTNIVTTTGTNAYGTDSESTTIIYNPAQTEQPPVVYFVDPNTSPYTTENNTFVINADVLNVAGAQNILFKQNGNVNQNFVYNAQTDDFQSTVVLNPGQNVFEIIGSNNAGVASASTIIIYNRPAPKPPIVTITNPSNNPHETSNAVYNMTSTVLNVTQASQITVKLNGQNIPFNYNPGTNGVVATLNLVNGSNVVVVAATNADGSDSKQTTIIYRPTQVVQPPVVQVTIPNADPFTVNSATYTLQASVLNVPTIAGVNVNVNGSNVTNFTFASNTVTLPLTLIEGANVITITGTNTAGTASDQQTIIYRKPAPAQPPVVSYVDPATSPTTVYNATYAVKARVRYVTSASQISLWINGTQSTNFVYSASSEIMDFTTALVPGANVINIVATNSAGQGNASTTIIYRRQENTNPPVVHITNPASNPSTVQTVTTPISATVLNVDNQSNITVTVNGTGVTNFTFNTTTKQVDFIANLINGSNTVTVTGTNTAGTASDSRTINLQREQTVSPPFVSFLNPSTAGTLVNNPAYTVKVKVTNVNSANQIVFVQDGQVVNPSLWVFDAGTKELTYNTTLNSGNNVFTATGTNTAGSHTASTNIMYKAPVVACDKPVVTITSPSTNGTEVTNNQLNFTATITNITNANQVKVLVNGNLQASGSYATATQTYSRTLTLSEGQNVIEVLAMNACGETKAIATITYKRPSAPCVAPQVQRIDPMNSEMVVEVATIQVKAAVLNISAASQVTVTLNGTVIPASYDNGSHLVTANVNLIEGNNSIIVTATNSCGTNNLEWKVTRKACTRPTFILKNTSAANGSTVVAAHVNIVGSFEGITAEEQITATHNGTPVGFVFNLQAGILTLNRELAIGLNTFVFTIKNSCGTETVKFTVTRKEVIKVQPPTITITNPATTGTTVNESGLTVTMTTTNVTAQNQVTVTLNGVPTNFTFNPTDGSISFNATLKPGSNTIVGTAVNSAGTATDTKGIIYRGSTSQKPPSIIMHNPKNCPATFPRGVQTISGVVANVTDPSKLTITMNGKVLTPTTQVSGTSLAFTVQINVMMTTVNIPLVITATNDLGTDTKTCSISIDANTTTPPEGGGEGGNGTMQGGSQGQGQGGSQNNGGNGQTIKPVIRPE